MFFIVVLVWFGLVQFGFGFGFGWLVAFLIKIMLEMYSTAVIKYLQKAHNYIKLFRLLLQLILKRTLLPSFTPTRNLPIESLPPKVYQIPKMLDYSERYCRVLHTDKLQ